MGQPLTGDALAIGYPYHYSNLCDKNGMFLGQTPCDGDVLFNLFIKSRSRLYYNFLCVGTMGSGKSTLLKKCYYNGRLQVIMSEHLIFLENLPG